MHIIKALSFVSVEGFWEKEIHHQRIAEAAKKLLDNPSALAIATATHAPAPCVSFTKQPLGQYTANKLIKDYHIAPMRILPAYLFDQKTTYTIIDAYSNAIMIGWLCCGLNKNQKITKVELNPTTAGFPVQAERIMILNKRASRILESLSIKVDIQPPSTIMPFDQLLIENPEEASKLLKIKKPGEVIDTGKWIGNSDIKRSFDDIEAMRLEILKAFKVIFGNQTNYSELFNLSDLERLLLTFIWNAKTNVASITDKDLGVIYCNLDNYFEQLDDEAINKAKNKLIAMGFI